MLHWKICQQLRANRVDPSKTIQQKLKQKTNPKLHLDEYYKPPRITTIFPMT